MTGEDIASKEATILRRELLLNAGNINKLWKQRKCFLYIPQILCESSVEYSTEWNQSKGNRKSYLKVLFWGEY